MSEIVIESGPAIVIEGQKGDSGVSISSTQINPDGELVITLTDATVINAGAVVGADGSAGRSITSAEINQAGELVLGFSDETNSNLGNVIGPKGDKGDKGDKGEPGDSSAGSGVAIGQGVLQASSIPAADGFLDAVGYDFFRSEYPDLAPHMPATYNGSYTSPLEAGFPYAPYGDAELGTILGVDVSKDGSMLALLYYKESAPRLRVYNTIDWSVIAGSEKTLTSGASAYYMHVAISPDGAKVATAEQSSTGDNIRIFNTSDWSEVSIQSIPSSSQIGAISWSFDSDYLAVANKESSQPAIVINSADGSYRSMVSGLSDSNASYVEFHPTKPILFVGNDYGVIVIDTTEQYGTLLGDVPMSVASQRVKGAVVYNSIDDTTTFFIGSYYSQFVSVIAEDYMGDWRDVDSFDLGSGNTLMSVSKYPESFGNGYEYNVLLSITNKARDFHYKYISYAFENGFDFYFIEADSTSLPQLIGADAEQIVFRDDILIYLVASENRLFNYEPNQLKLVRFGGPGSFKLNPMMPLGDFKYVIKAK